MSPKLSAQKPFWLFPDLDEKITHFQCGLQYTCVHVPQKNTGKKRSSQCVFLLLVMRNQVICEPGYSHAAEKRGYNSSSFPQPDQSIPNKQPTCTKTPKTETNEVNRLQMSGNGLKLSFRQLVIIIIILLISLTVSLILFQFRCPRWEFGIWRLNQLGCLCQCGFKPITRAQALIASKHTEIRSHQNNATLFQLCVLYRN